MKKDRSTADLYNDNDCVVFDWTKNEYGKWRRWGNRIQFTNSLAIPHQLKLKPGTIVTGVDWDSAEVEGWENEVIRSTIEESSAVNHPSHYNTGGIEAIDVIEAWELDFRLGNALKYLSRAGKKDPSKTRQDLEKAIWYIKRYIDKALYTDKESK